MKCSHNRKGKAGKVDALIGKRLTYYRKLRGYTQKQLGDEVGITFQQIQKYESGKNRIPASTLLAFSRALSVPVTGLYEEAHGFIDSERSASISAAKIRLVDTIINSNDPKLDRVMESFGKLLYGLSVKD